MMSVPRRSGLSVRIRLYDQSASTYRVLGDIHEAQYGFVSDNRLVIGDLGSNTFFHEYGLNNVYARLVYSQIDGENWRTQYVHFNMSRLPSSNVLRVANFSGDNYELLNVLPSGVEYVLNRDSGLTVTEDFVSTNISFNSTNFSYNTSAMYNVSENWNILTAKEAVEYYVMSADYSQLFTRFGFGVQLTTFPIHTGIVNYPSDIVHASPQFFYGFIEYSNQSNDMLVGSTGQVKITMSGLATLNFSEALITDVSLGKNRLGIEQRRIDWLSYRGGAVIVLPSPTWFPIPYTYKQHPFQKFTVFTANRFWALYLNNDAVGVYATKNVSTDWEYNNSGLTYMFATAEGLGADDRNVFYINDSAYTTSSLTFYAIWDAITGAPGNYSRRVMGTYGYFMEDGSIDWMHDPFNIFTNSWLDLYLRDMDIFLPQNCSYVLAGFNAFNNWSQKNQFKMGFASYANKDTNWSNVYSEEWYGVGGITTDRVFCKFVECSSGVILVEGGGVASKFWKINGSGVMASWFNASSLVVGNMDIVAVGDSVHCLDWNTSNVGSDYFVEFKHQNASYGSTGLGDVTVIGSRRIGAETYAATIGGFRWGSDLYAFYSAANSLSADVPADGQKITLKTYSGGSWGSETNITMDVNQSFAHLLSVPNSNISMVWSSYGFLPFIWQEGLSQSRRIYHFYLQS